MGSYDVYPQASSKVADIREKPPRAESSEQSLSLANDLPNDLGGNQKVDFKPTL